MQRKAAKAARLREDEQNAALSSHQHSPQAHAQREQAGATAQPAPGSSPAASPPNVQANSRPWHGEVELRAHGGSGPGASIEDDEEFWQEMVREREQEKAQSLSFRQQPACDRATKPISNTGNGPGRRELYASSAYDSLDASSSQRERQGARPKPSIRMLATEEGGRGANVGEEKRGLNGGNPISSVSVARQKAGSGGGKQNEDEGRIVMHSVARALLLS